MLACDVFPTCEKERMTQDHGRGKPKEESMFALPERRGTLKSNEMHKKDDQDVGKKCGGEAEKRVKLTRTCSLEAWNKRKTQEQWTLTKNRAPYKRLCHSLLLQKENSLCPKTGEKHDLCLERTEKNDKTKRRVLEAFAKAFVAYRLQT